MLAHTFRSRCWSGSCTAAPTEYGTRSVPTTLNSGFFTVASVRYRLAVGWLGHGLQDFFDHLIDVDPFGVGVEVGEDAVPQHGIGHRADVVGADGEPAVQDRPGLCRRG